LLGFANLVEAITTAQQSTYPGYYPNGVDREFVSIFRLAMAWPLERIIFFCLSLLI
jgi:hypothetical protein